jgi:hypothetical protein
LEILKKEEVPEIKNNKIRHIIRNSAPNWVQKNMRYAASTALLVLANL